MAITFTNGSITTSASEQTVYDVTADEHFATWLYMHNMTATETFVIKTYVKDSNLSVLRQYDSTSLTGVQASPAYYIPWIPAQEYKVTIQRTAGSDKSVTWLRAESV